MSDLAIETALTLRRVFHRPLRQTEGFVRSLLRLMTLALEALDHTTLSRRAHHLNVHLRCQALGGPLHLFVDSSGLAIVGEAEWAAARHGGNGKRGWKKLQLGVDRSGVIVAQILIDGTEVDAASVSKLIDQIEGDLRSFAADRAYDTSAVYKSARARGARVVVPATKTATRSRDEDGDAARDAARSREYRNSGGGMGRRSRATIARPEWRSSSSAPSRFSVIGCGRETQARSGPTQPPPATS